MNKLKKLIFVLIVIVFFILLGLFLIGYFRPKNAGINVFTNEASSVYIDGQFVGKTPFQKNLASKEILLKIVTDSNQNMFETKLSLTPGVETIIKRDFGMYPNSAGEVVSFEKTADNTSSLAIVTSPDKSQVTIDDRILGFSPIQIDTLSEGEHSVVISTPGYGERVLPIKTHAGYKLTAIVDLEKSEAVIETPPKIVKQLKILSTPNGFLRVREKQSTNSAELSQVYPDSIFNYDEEVSGWFRIEYSTGAFGWISSQYAEVLGGSN